MSVKTRTDQNGIDLDEHMGSDRYALGIDADGNVHYHKRGGDVIRVVDPEAGEQVHIQHLDGRPVEDWIDYVADQAGWDDLRYGTGLAGALADVLGGGER